MSNLNQNARHSIIHSKQLPLWTDISFLFFPKKGSHVCAILPSPFSSNRLGSTPIWHGVKLSGGRRETDRRSAKSWGEVAWTLRWRQNNFYLFKICCQRRDSNPRLQSRLELKSSAIDHSATLTHNIIMPKRAVQLLHETWEQKSSSGVASALLHLMQQPIRVWQNLKYFWI